VWLGRWSPALALQWEFFVLAPLLLVPLLLVPLLLVPLLLALPWGPPLPAALMCLWSPIRTQQR